jgi:60 kDa SS-A/Ro ribonucleoprotein
MGKYNTTKKSTVVETVTHQGGVGYQHDAKIELIGLLATGLDNTFYEKEGDREKRLAALIEEVAKRDKTFVAKALVYARTKMGQRTVTHVGAVNLAKHLSGDDLGKNFYSKRDRKENKGGIVFRLDDMLEILACYVAKNPSQKTRKNGQPSITLPNSIKKGFKAALENADAYELAKYQAKGKEISLVDIVNLVHPKPSAKMKPVFEQLMKGELKQFNTVEDKNTKVGQEVAAKVKSGEITKEQAEVELKEAKEDNYAELIRSRKIGYLALLRNLRNILKNSSDKELISDACALLTDEKLIRQSLVFPHHIDLALEIMLTEFSNSEMSKFANALNTAYELAIPNLKELFQTGRTAVVFDSSGSMSSPVQLSNKARTSAAITKAALIAATLAKGIGADVYHFANYTQQIKFNPADSVNTLKNQFISKQGEVGYGTAFNSIMGTLGKNYDRVFIISDMQSGSGPLGNTKEYVYSIDITGYGTTSIKPGQKVFQIFGYSAEIYELIKKVEIDPKQILKEIEAIQI